jgi:hypothetical protein
MAVVEKPTSAEMLKRLEPNIRLDEYCKSLMGSVEHEAFEQKNGLYTIVFYSNRVVTHRIKNCTYAGKMFMLPRVQKSPCLLRGLYLRFKLFN